MDQPMPPPSEDHQITPLSSALRLLQKLPFLKKRHPDPAHARQGEAPVIVPQSSAGPPLPQEPSLDLFTGPLPRQEICTYINTWDCCNIIPAVGSSSANIFDHLVVIDVSLVQQQVKEFQHEFLRIQVLNKNTRNIFTAIAQRYLSPSEDQSTKGMAIDELYILPEGDQSSKSSGMILRRMGWTEHLEPPLLTDVIKLLCKTSKVLTKNYNATSFNCYCFAIVAFHAIERFRSQVTHRPYTHKVFKQSAILGFKLLDKHEVYKEVIEVLVLFFEQELGKTWTQTRARASKPGKSLTSS